MERAVLVYTTWPSIVEAEQAGRGLVEARLAACVNIVTNVPIPKFAMTLLHVRARTSESKGH